MGAVGWSAITFGGHYSWGYFSPHLDKSLLPPPHRNSEKFYFTHPHEIRKKIFFFFLLNVKCTRYCIPTGEAFHFEQTKWKPDSLLTVLHS